MNLMLCSIDHALAAPKATVPWDGLRNTRPANFMRVSTGLASHCRPPCGGYTQFSPQSPYLRPSIPAVTSRAGCCWSVQALKKMHPDHRRLNCAVTPNWRIARIAEGQPPLHPRGGGQHWIHPRLMATRTAS
ncbi:hypothetical protein FQR65_LT19023 [Abscondita terminalis]|nr:hypothetical protein FQR65_LT19023 [Abscondita terminalis]